MTVSMTVAPPRDGRDFRLFWFGETAGKVGSGISGVAVPLAAVTVPDASAFQVGALIAMAWLPWLLVGLPTGA